MLGFAAIPLLMRYLGGDGYGLWVLILAVLGVAMLAEGGLATSVTYYAARDIGSRDYAGLGNTVAGALLATFVLAAFMAVMLYFMADSIINLFDTLGEAQQLAASAALRIGVISLVALLLQNVLNGLLHGMQRFDVSNLLSTLQVAVNTGGFIIISAQGGGVVQLMTWQVAVSLAILTLYVLVVARLLPPWRGVFRFDRTRVTAVWKYGVMTWTGALGGVLFTQLDRIVVGKLLGTSTLGVYGAITGVVRQINAFAALPVQPLLSEVAQLNTAYPDLDVIRSKVRKALHVNTLGALGLGVLLFTLAPVVVPLLLDRVALNSEINGLRIAALIYALFSLNGVGYYVLLAMNGVRAFMVVQLMSGLLAVIMIAWGARFGLLGALAGQVGYLGVSALSLLGMRYLRVGLSTWLGWIRPALAWAGATAIVAVLMPQHVAVLLGLALVQCAVLTLWFAREQPALFQTLTHPWQLR